MIGCLDDEIDWMYVDVGEIMIELYVYGKLECYA